MQEGIPTNKYGGEDPRGWRVHKDGSVNPTDVERYQKLVQHNLVPLAVMHGQKMQFLAVAEGEVLFSDMEVISRVLPYEDDSLKEIWKVLWTINQKTKAIVVPNSPAWIGPSTGSATFAPQSSGLHVHVGNRNRGFPIQTIKNFLTLMCICQ